MTVQLEPAPGELQGREALGRLLAWLLVALWTLVLLGLVFLSPRSSTWAELEAQAAAGEVSSVRVVGGLPPGARGYSTVELEWRQGAFWRSTELVQATHGARVPAETRSDVSQVVREDVRERLRNAGVDVDDAGAPRYTATVLGWEVPGWMGLSTLALWIVTLLRVVAEPRPRRATRWGWFWLVLLTVPLGPLAFLLAGGPTARTVAAEHEREGRLTGGWAFLLALLVGSALGTVG
jgi:hypothetical protein